MASPIRIVVRSGPVLPELLQALPGIGRFPRAGEPELGGTGWFPVINRPA